MTKLEKLKLLEHASEKVNRVWTGSAQQGLGHQPDVRAAAEGDVESGQARHSKGLDTNLVEVTKETA